VLYEIGLRKIKSGEDAILKLQAWDVSDKEKET
jgi:hypothetical protein